MFATTTKTLVAALVLVAASVSLAATVQAAPRGDQTNSFNAETYFDRASKNYDGSNGN